jgi:hypothetical protein
MFQCDANRWFVQCGNLDIDVCAGPMCDLRSFSNKLPNLNLINSKVRVLTFPSYWKIFLFSQNNVKAQLSLRIRVRRLKQYNFKKLLQGLILKIREI